MTTLTTLTFIEEPAGDVYRKLLLSACARCTQFQWVVRSGTSTATLQEVLALFEPRLLHKRRALEWPGTRLLGEEAATVYLYKFDEEAAGNLAGLTEGLFGWLHPDRPEDLCLTSAESPPWLVSISHERDAWITTSEEDARVLFAEIAGLGSILRRSG